MNKIVKLFFWANYLKMQKKLILLAQKSVLAMRNNHSSTCKFFSLLKTWLSFLINAWHIQVCSSCSWSRCFAKISLNLRIKSRLSSKRSIPEPLEAGSGDEAHASPGLRYISWTVIKLSKAGLQLNSPQNNSF